MRTGVRRRRWWAAAIGVGRRDARWATAVMAFVSGRAGPVDVAYFYWSGPAADDGLDCPIIDFFVLFCGFGFQLVSFLNDTHLHVDGRERKEKKKNSI